ncbi:rhamnan synthesis F family protein [Acidisoma silvae]|uniref:Lipopolysaccharide biosynthesis protein n=1 Tax=Acidisoma silvae TaxID=2802396 RepID=A0A964DXM2_9PROT|nr:rhamnan synthesis F family protein [Acidisoma silvae]MCB8873858.1 lipopolysaccharide biosynthesis protein [Acidisoma silvae]
MTWRVLVRRFRDAENRPLAARNLARHALRAAYARMLRLYHPMRSAARECSVQLRIAAAWPLGFLHSTHQVVERYDDPEQLLGADVALFVHFDAEGRVLPATRAFLSGLAQTGLSIVFVTNSGFILEEDKAFLREHCRSILIRRNLGYDFGAWRDALDTLGLPRADTRAVYLVNDSVYGPFTDLAPLLATIDFDQADIWGVTESWQHHYHLQSFFLACGETAIRSQSWRRFWASVRPIPCKDWVIRHCEIGFTRALAKGGITTAALFPNESLLDRAELDRLEQVVAADDEADGQNARLRAEAVHAERILFYAQREPVPLNPSIDLWRQLLQAGYPFLKRELLLRNPTRVADVFEWEEVVSQSLHADPQPLADEIRQSLGTRLAEVWNDPAGIRPKDAA